MSAVAAAAAPGLLAGEAAFGSGTGYDAGAADVAEESVSMSMRDWPTWQTSSTA